MTDRFKEVADLLNKYKPHLSGMGGSIGTAELGVFTRNHIDILTEALYLAQDNEDSAVRYYKVCLELADKRIEAEQLREKLAETVIHLMVRNGEIEQLRKERDELAKTVLEAKDRFMFASDKIMFSTEFAGQINLAKKVNENV